MTRAQFQVYSQGRGAGEWLRGADVPLRWRLITGNHRDLGRGVRVYDSVDGATAEVHALVAGLDDLDSAFSVGTTDQLWWWSLSAGQTLMARSSRGYSRRIECDLSVRQFRTLAAQAAISPTPRVFGPRGRGGVGVARPDLPPRPSGLAAGAFRHGLA